MLHTLLLPAFASPWHWWDDPSAPGCSPALGQDRFTLPFLFPQSLSAGDVQSATLAIGGALEMLVGDHQSMVPSDCEPIIDTNAFVVDHLPGDPRAYASAHAVAIAGTDTEFSLSDVLVFETHPGQGMSWNERST